MVILFMHTADQFHTGFVTIVTRRVSLVEQELPTLPEHLSSPHPPILVGFVLLDLQFYASFCPFSFCHCVLRLTDTLVCSNSFYTYPHPVTREC